MQFIRKTSSTRNIFGIIVKLFLGIFIAATIVFLLNKIEFPSPDKKIEKIIPNENFKTIK